MDCFMCFIFRKNNSDLILFRFRNEFYPAQPPPQNHAYWDYRHGPPPPGNINSDSTFLHPPQVQIPLTASHRSLDSPAEFYKNKKS